MIDDLKPPAGPGAEERAKQTPDEPTLPPLDFMKPATSQTITPSSNASDIDTEKLQDMLGEPPSGEALTDSTPPAKKGFWNLDAPAWWERLSNKQRGLLVVASLVALGIVSGGGSYLYMHSRKPPVIAISPAPKKVVTTVASNLTGLQVDPSVNQRPVTAVMIENSLFARPQSGLDQAGVVFEAIAEAGITRFMGLYQDTQPGYLGPVRSVRPYYEQWAMGFDAAIAHVGGSPEALRNIKTWGVKDLDQFYNAGAYHRISSRYAPHNMYTSMAALNKVEKSKGYGAARYTGFDRKKEAPLKKPDVTTINFNISTNDYHVRYTYDAKNNSYLRSMGGAKHYVVDAKGKKTQLDPKVVIAMVMHYGLESDGYHSTYSAVGSGNVYVFQDGTVTKGTWSKPSKADQFKFYDMNGHPLALNPGQTWLTAVGSASDVTYH
ncbi:MAG TPA: DUF3048 domain-containing protein [Candidatus Saccharimonadales bacterium]|nr:DUF3048 domain-containing protein [Candidatus Saccharimonadales bacterium]